ncbi:MAG: oligopeptide transporter permease protein [Symbiobacteriaceae bacterium]|jgi:ABC-type dipeptide/oligopeptide/nickel transport system permease subunit|nr:oligopeptide transporter permease protein [Symbiobacteriaceae bacterium]
MSTYTERFIRFGAALVSVGMLLLLLVSPYWPLPPLSERAAAFILPSIKITGQYLGIGLLGALPLALLLGLPAGLRPGTRLNRALTLPFALVAGIPIPVFAMLLFFPLSLRHNVLDMASLAKLITALVAAAWITPAIRDRVAEAAPGFMAKAVAVAGAILGQAGTLFVTVAVMEQFFPLGGGIFRLVTDGVRLKDFTLMLVGLTLFTAPVLLLHLAGDLLVTRSQGRTSARPAGSTGWTILGVLLTAALVGTALATFAEPVAVATAKLHPPGDGHLLGTDRQGRDLLAVLSLSVRNAIKHASYGTYAAMIIGAVLGGAGAAAGRWGRILLSPRVTFPALFGPFFVLMCSALLVSGKTWVSALLAGAICAPALAPAVRQVVRAAAWPDRRRALIAALGAGLLVFAQIMGAETAAYQFKTFDSGVGLYAVIGATLQIKGAPYQYWAIIIMAVGTAGPWLLGNSLMAAHEPEPEEA